uniref:Large ribosomal subunit protein eL22 n=1 Tax=Strombidium rassoulzadegani TaxID=1082188 RepID=A0A7S3CMG4_9SPIT|mmetsp:Transcript_16515/g.28053  ORF Transcript_16515/g.28053 Transcript_16515/m.28053 type:complete len:124 (+) Transcript_16515:45-416(+)|eukprot:CAMPEP_0168612192 /NCGR_PEP_ID=MMETSP0449_2-20121227/2774_1 /TAXON_ID=1082188 /ORGANISM="Strombidium rassoulzadegani, Strain ras09" /LENGTH=123 /DNA_ID=CAMNT_0008652717 /DNA_START=24 /DNA_END=395 /DNA_ORIENTATION=-
MGKQVQAKKTDKTAKKINHKFTINCKLTIEDNIIVLKDFEQYLASHIKVNNKPGALGKSVTVNSDGSNVVVESSIPFSKRYLKYLTKKYLKKQELKEFLRVIATSKNAYELRYFKIQNEEAAE